ncbi:GRP family sugar transporter [Ereboglobus luteus]|uniref:Multidrug DMT transporter permease n=1 Tax=Ereboglobus luteus TaxID=1796921 RepID=A0A2U8E258_9BACT|nr:GRP family sugar transporter [Ereboglobus luteus]AWI08953.1 multidrug DMT transporter permease [Ereboglobus luteus]
MLTIQSYPVAVILCFVTMLCWGSWGNTQKLASREWKYQLFYWDYGLGVLLSALVMAFTIGSIGSEGRGFLADISQAGTNHMALAFLGGVLFNLSNILLVIAIDIAGLAVAFPIGVGLALVVGTLQTAFFRPGEVGNATQLYIGVALVAVAIVLNALAYKKLMAAKSGGGKSGGSAFGIVISVVAGLLMGGGFFGLVSKGMIQNFAAPEPGLMTPYTALVVFALGLFLSNFVWNTIASKKPVRGEPVPVSDYFTKGNLRLHAVGVLGGTVWNIGMAFSLIAASAAGAALSYALGQCATMVAAVWGVFIWKEFKGAPKGTSPLLAAMFITFFIGIAFLVISKL